MRTERIAEDIYIFTSEIYAHVTATAILTEEGAILIDTLPLPEESREMAAFVRRRSPEGVRYVINTHFHADHVNGTYLYPEAHVIAHRRCREFLLTFGQEALNAAKAENPALEEVELVIPNIVFDHELALRLGNHLLYLLHLPGHTPDNIGVIIEGNRVLIAGDAVLPVPYFTWDPNVPRNAWGDWQTLYHTLQRIREMNLEAIVQGHGDVLLRGEIPYILQDQMQYLDCLHEKAQALLDVEDVRAAITDSIPEDCAFDTEERKSSISSIPLDGLVRYMHQANLMRMYTELKEQQATA
ncbi:hypothetical protein ARMA_0018 [Ardenticatena maritima]|uniref:Metallo-beta-lactamase domain-containing protein n=1 Tax=Ardenticatena maritima TaxID=872965 RepID=A0A0M8K4T8_9CHLR|nr:MBL fold metallo-hydrolase [Ardenticatena maritima]KPL87980.1 hypothetical protein SE16_10720 [Ardenticatena maritima]GAP61595.1 hypothetical protein ARMA_0018 [Ardenticatena maritima]